MTQREKFDEWWLSSKYRQVVNCGDYDQSVAWDGWQASAKQQEEENERIRESNKRLAFHNKSMQEVIARREAIDTERKEAP